MSGENSINNIRDILLLQNSFYGSHSDSAIVSVSSKNVAKIQHNWLYCTFWLLPVMVGG